MKLTPTYHFAPRLTDMLEFNKLLKPALPDSISWTMRKYSFDSRAARMRTRRFLLRQYSSRKMGIPGGTFMLSFATADAWKHRITTLRCLIRLAPEITSFVIIENKSMSVTLTFDAAGGKPIASPATGRCFTGRLLAAKPHAPYPIKSPWSTIMARPDLRRTRLRQAARQTGYCLIGDPTGRSRGLQLPGWCEFTSFIWPA